MGVHESKRWWVPWWLSLEFYMYNLLCASWAPLEWSGSSDRHAGSIFSGVWGQMRQSYIWRLGWGGEKGLESLILIMYLTLGMGKNRASKTMTWLTFTEHSKQKEVYFPLIEVCQPVTYSACWLLFTLHRESPKNSKASQTCPFLHGWDQQTMWLPPLPLQSTGRLLWLKHHIKPDMELKLELSHSLLEQ